MPLDEHPKTRKVKVSGREVVLFRPPKGVDSTEFAARINELKKRYPLYTASRVARLEFLGVMEREA